MDNKRICPILTAVAMGGTIATACQREGCAWWVERKQSCAIEAMGRRA